MHKLLGTQPVKNVYNSPVKKGRLRDLRVDKEIGCRLKTRHWLGVYLLKIMGVVNYMGLAIGDLF